MFIVHYNFDPNPMESGASLKPCATSPFAVMAAESAATWVPLMLKEARIVRNDAELRKLVEWVMEIGLSLEYLLRDNFFEQLVIHMNLREIPMQAMKQAVKTLSERLPTPPSSPPRVVMKDNAGKTMTIEDDKDRRSRSPSLRAAGPRASTPGMGSRDYLCMTHNKIRTKSKVEPAGDGQWRCKRDHTCGLGSARRRTHSPMSQTMPTRDISKAMSMALRYPDDQLPLMHRDKDGGIDLRDFQRDWADPNNVSEREVKNALGKHLFKSPDPRRDQHQALRFSMSLHPSTKRVTVRSPAPPRARR